jgi:hypothetical protein
VNSSNFQIKKINANSFAINIGIKTFDYLKCSFLGGRVVCPPELQAHFRVRSIFKQPLNRAIGRPSKRASLHPVHLPLR